MKTARQFGIVVVLLVSYLTPAMACMISGVQMTASERACCRAMSNQCEQMGMPASHGCCQKTTQGTHDNALDTKSFVYHPVAVTATWLTGSESLCPAPIAMCWIEHANYSPPQSPPSSAFILRI